MLDEHKISNDIIIIIVDDNEKELQQYGRYRFVKTSSERVQGSIISENLEKFGEPLCSRIKSLDQKLN